MLKSIFAVGVCIFALMIVIKDGRVLRTTGLTGLLGRPDVPDGVASSRRASPGKLEGRPDLTSRGCITVGISGKLEYWRCPAELQASDARAADENRPPDARRRHGRATSRPAAPVSPSATETHRARARRLRSERGERLEQAVVRLGPVHGDADRAGDGRTAKPRSSSAS